MSRRVTRSRTAADIGRPTALRERKPSNVVEEKTVAESKKSTIVNKRPTKRSTPKSRNDETPSKKKKMAPPPKADSDDDEGWEETSSGIKEGAPISITVARPKSKREREIAEWVRTALRREINRYRKGVRLDAHKLHLLHLVARLVHLSRHAASNPLIQSLCLSHIPVGYIDLSYAHSSVDTIKRLCSWFASAYPFNRAMCLPFEEGMKSLRASIADRRPISALENVLIFVATMRCVGIPCRLVSSLHPIAIKLSDPQRPDVRYTMCYSNPGVQSNESASTAKPKKSTAKKGGKTTKRSPLPSIDHWAEVYVEAEETWYSVHVCDGCAFDKPRAHMSSASSPVHYVVAVDEQHSCADVMPRYLLGDALGKTVRQLRADDDYVAGVLTATQPRRRGNLLRERIEQMHFEELLKSCPFPKTVSEFHRHPLYALERDLLKFEAIYPSDMPPLGHVRNLAVFPRSAVRQLHSADTWRKAARQVKTGERPYKIVQARPKMGVPKERQEVDRPLPVFGEWQTDEYIPPTATNGIVPRNDFGNVELFKECMLPMGCTHLTPFPRLLDVARRLDIDCAAAMIGWDFHGGRSHPLLDGWVVCTEHVTALTTAYEEYERLRVERERAKVREAAIEHWKKFTRGLLIKHRLDKDMLAKGKPKQRRGVRHDDVLEESVAEEGEEEAELPIAWPPDQQRKFQLNQ